MSSHLPNLLLSSMSRLANTRKTESPIVLSDALELATGRQSTDTTLDACDKWGLEAARQGWKTRRLPHTKRARKPARAASWALICVE